MEIEDQFGGSNKMVEDADLNLFEDGGNDGKKENGSKKQEEKKKPKKPMVKLDPMFLIDNPRGLKKLYKNMVIDGDKNLNLKGKGHEISDLNRVMKVLKGWHFECMPKIEISYFAQRMQKVGNDKDTKAFLGKLRNVYKGLEVLDDFQQATEEAGNFN